MSIAWPLQVPSSLSVWQLAHLSAISALPNSSAVALDELLELVVVDELDVAVELEVVAVDDDVVAELDVVVEELLVVVLEELVESLLWDVELLLDTGGDLGSSLLSQAEIINANRPMKPVFITLGKSIIMTFPIWK